MSSSGSIIKLNIGGTIFQTTKSTLTRFDGFFKTILETEIPVTKDESGAIFIDRNPKHFGKILDFMRDDDVTLPKSEEKCEEILKEAQYYLLEDLMEKCKNNIPTEIAKKIERLNENYQIATLFDKCLAKRYTIHYRLEDWSVVFRDISVEEFVEKHKETKVFYFVKLPKGQCPDGCWRLSYTFEDKKYDPLQVDAIDFLKWIPPPDV